MTWTAAPLALLAAMLAVGCATPPATRAPGSAAPAASGPTANLSGYPPEFRDGYRDGCSSGRGTRTRNEGRFKSDSQYASGWRDGFDICSRQR
jgi:hypothetical protein